MTYRFWVWTMVGVTAACIVVDTMLLMVWNYSLDVQQGPDRSMAGR